MSKNKPSSGRPSGSQHMVDRPGPKIIQNGLDGITSFKPSPPPANTKPASGGTGGNGGKK